MGGDSVRRRETRHTDGIVAPLGAAGGARYRHPAGPDHDGARGAEATPARSRRTETRQRDPAEGVGVFRPGGARPPSEVMVRFIDQHRDQYGVEPICSVLPIAPSTYFLRKVQQQDPTQRSARARRDDALRATIQRVWDANQHVYGPKKVWKELHRQGIRVARCTIARLMRAMGLRGVSRGRAWVITTRGDAVADRPADLVDRHFLATRPNQLWVADFTYVATWRGFVYVAFVIDVFARTIVGWRVSSSLRTDFVLDALEQAIYQRCGAEVTDLVHHSDRGTQYLSMRYTERLADAGIAPSVGSRGDSYDNAMAESIIGLFKTEVIQRKGPWRHLEAVEFATLTWVDWFNTRRLLGPIGYVPPAEYEAQYYAQLNDDSTAHPESRRGARRQPHPDDSPHGPAVERPHGLLRRLDTEITEQIPHSH